MSDTLKEKEPQSTDTAPNKSSNANHRFRLLLPFIALLAGLALLVLALFIYFGVGENKVVITPTSLPAKTPAAFEGLEQPGPITDFGIRGSSNPTATPIPTDNEPARLLLTADDFLLQGRSVEAAAQYRLILDSHAGSPQARQALYGLARSDMQRDRYSAAADGFKKYLATYPNDPQRAQCYYYLGLADEQQGYWDEAITYFQKYRDEKPGPLPLDGYAAYEIATAYEKLAKPQQAADLYKKAAESQTSTLLRVTAMEKLGDYYVKAGNLAEGANWYSKLLELAKIPEYRATIIAKQAHTYDAAGQGPKAVDLTRSLVNDYLDTSTGFSTLKTLFNLNSPLLDDYLKGYYLMRAGDNAGALEALDRFLGRADDKAPQPPTSAGISKDGQNRLAQGWYYLATLYEAKNDLDRASAEYSGLVARFPQAPIAPQALWRLANLAEKQNKPDEAIKLYGQFATSYPAEANADEALYLQFSLSLAKGPEVAQPFADSLAQKYPGSNHRSEAFYELGRAYQAKGDVPATRTAFQKASLDPQADFYSVRAYERLIDAYDPNKPPRSNPDTHPAIYSPRTFAADLDSDRAAMDSWIIGWASPTAAVGNITPAPATAKDWEAVRQRIQNDPAIKRMAELKALGLDNQASRESKELLERSNDNPLELYALALTLSEKGDYYDSVAAAKRLLGLYLQKNRAAERSALPRLLQKLIYPLPYQPVILEQSRRYDFDPLLMAAMLRQESVFDPNAQSGAGAIGMAQVMPDTGKGIANNLGKTDFKVDDLLRPYTAIEFGAFYLSNRLNDFDGNPSQALAAYNGGAGNVYRWNKAAPPETNFDNWVNNIDYPETRTYVQIVYANYFMYRQIYAAK